MEAAGDIATGALLGRAVEPRAGEMARPDARTGDPHAHGLCLNCGTALIGAHCHACGQAGHIHRSLGSIAHDIAHGVFHFEGKIWRTLPMLALHPGALTRRYIAGERARFVSPLALFLFTVFLMFATISTFGGEIADIAPPVAEAKGKVAEIDAEIAKAQTELERVEASPGAAATGDVVALRTAIKALRVSRAAAGGDGFVFTELETGWKTLDKGIAKANANPGLLIYKLQSSAYKYSWALIPLSVPFVALMFLWRRRFQLYDHAIFVTYSIAFMMMLVIALILAGAIGVPGGLIAMTALFAPPAHMFAQLRGAYGLRKRSAVWRTVALMTFAFTVLTGYATLLLLQGLTA